MIFHQTTRNASQRLLYGSNLHDDVGAIAVGLDHFLQAADLAFNSSQPPLVALFEFRIDCDGLMARTDYACTFGRVRMGCCFASHRVDTPLRYLYPGPLYAVKSLRPAEAGPKTRWTTLGCYTTDMTLMEIKYALASPLTLEQLKQLSEFSNTYGLRKFKLNDAKTELSFEYDASRLRETEVTHVLGQAKIAVSKKLN